MKKLLGLVVTAASLFTFIGCNSSSSSKNENMISCDLSAVPQMGFCAQADETTMTSEVLAELGEMCTSLAGGTLNQSACSDAKVKCPVDVLGEASSLILDMMGGDADIDIVFGSEFKGMSCDDIKNILAGEDDNNDGDDGEVVSCDMAAAFYCTEFDAQIAEFMPCAEMGGTLGSGCQSGAVLECPMNFSGQSVTNYYYNDMYSSCDMIPAQQ